jgi:FkbM family methyltransferase
MRRLEQSLLTPIRRVVVRSNLLNHHLPWRLWCALGAVDSAAVAWVIAMRVKRPLTFVQIGSYDGVLADPLSPVVRACGWSGVLVEPMLAAFERLVANYDGVPNVTFENAAIGAADGLATLYSVPPRPGDPMWIEMIPSLDRATILSHKGLIPSVEERIVETPVTCMTLATLVSRHELQTIDILNIDTEGYDYEILKQIDFSAAWAPTFIIYERLHFNRATTRAARQLLHRAGYRIANIGADAFAYRTAPEAMGGTDGNRERHSSQPS